MNVLKNRALTLLSALIVAVAGCQGAKGTDGSPGANGANGTDGGSGANGSNGVSGVNGGVTTGLVLALTSAPTVNADQSVTIRFTAKDDQGFPVDLLKGKYSLNTVNVPRFAIAKIPVAADGVTVEAYQVMTGSGSVSLDPALPQPDPMTVFSPNAVTPSLTSPNSVTTGVLVENGTGAGDYSYTFPTGSITSAAGTGTNVGKTTWTANGGVQLDPSSTASYSIWIQATRQTNVSNVNDSKGFKAVNYQYNFIPGSNATPTKREIVLTASCNKCHNGFKPESTLASGGFHGYGRVEGPFCNVCHNAARKSAATNSDGVTPAADSAIFVHRLHSGKTIQTANVFHALGEATYPQDLRNCDACHKGAAQGSQAKSRADRAVCGSCHDYVVFSATPGFLACTNPVTVDASGLPVPCIHLPGANTDDTSCAGCHVAGGQYFIGDKHVAVAPPDPTSTYAGGTNANTNAAYLASAGAIPAGATKFTYAVKSVSRNSSKQPVIVFKLQQSTDGGPTTDVAFNAACAAAATKNTTTVELIDNNYVGSPSVYFAWAATEDGISKPADFNASTSAYIKGVCNDNGTATASGKISGPDSSGYYTLTVTGTATAPVIVPDSATMLTAGVGYTYSLSSTQPLTQINVPGYPYTSSSKIGGLTVPAPNVWAVASSGTTTTSGTTINGTQGTTTCTAAKPCTCTVASPCTAYNNRRDIVDNDKCKNCHAQLGAEPTFHAGQRNDGPTCSFCHTPNRTSSGWSANGKDFIHGVHAGVERSTPFTWHAKSATEGYWDITLPGQLNYCQACHKPGTYDYSATASANAVTSLLQSTVATGKFDPASTSAYAFSPFITADNTTDYGYGYSTSDILGDSSTQIATGSAGDGYKQKDTYCSGSAQCTCTSASKCSLIVKLCSTTTPCQADGSTLVTSPITAACVACHDDAASKAHMKGNGGSFYATRDVAAGNVEQCLLCHGPQPGAIAPIGPAHQ